MKAVFEPAQLPQETICPSVDFFITFSLPLQTTKKQVLLLLFGFL